MEINTILFDLDGTLLPLDQDDFVKAYFYEITKVAQLHGYEPKRVSKTIWNGTKAMQENDGSKTNEEVFWGVFANEYGVEALKDKSIFDKFYLDEFRNIKDICGYNPKVPALIDELKASGYRLALATNPIFPDTATRLRIYWSGLSLNSFELYTTYENSYHCKPNPDYYWDVLTTLGVTPQQCLMVGNDVDEDMVAQKLGMQVFLLTDNIVNKNNSDISIYPNGDFDKLREFIQTLN